MLRRNATGRAEFCGWCGLDSTALTIESALHETSRTCPVHTTIATGTGSMQSEEYPSQEALRWTQQQLKPRRCPGWCSPLAAMGSNRRCHVSNEEYKCSICIWQTSVET